ncbi:MAG: HU family DNA-binding protein [Candidatus Bipolaricaulota bacterium]|nr:HU family DNA-binding protein [Candidatus Bipolaricaulota bacterium]
MNKGEFVDKLATKTGLTKKDARKALDATIDLITDALVSNKEVLLTGFGKFEARARKESKRINPQTQKRITVPKKVVPAFKPGKNLKDIVAKKLKAVKVGSDLKVKKAR